STAEDSAAVPISSPEVRQPIDAEKIDAQVEEEELEKVAATKQQQPDHQRQLRSIKFLPNVLSCSDSQEEVLDSPTSEEGEVERGGVSKTWENSSSTYLTSSAKRRAAYAHHHHPYYEHPSLGTSKCGGNPSFGSVSIE